MPLTGAATRHLRSLAHDLSPVVLMGKEGLTKKVLAAIDDALEAHELIKVRLKADDRVERQILAAQISGPTGSEIVQIMGSVLTLYRPRKKEPTLAIPEGYTPADPVSRARDEDE